MHAYTRPLFAIALAAVLSAPAAPVLAAKPKPADMSMILEFQSPYNFEQTIAAISDKAKERGWKVPMITDFKQTMIKEGQPDIGNVSVLRMCQPDKAYRVLSSDGRKFLSVMMPCAISVYEKNDGKVFIAMINIGLMKEIYGPAMPDVMVEVEQDMKSFLAFALEGTDPTKVAK